MNPTSERLPVTVLSGFLGAGKTTLLKIEVDLAGLIRAEDHVRLATRLPWAGSCQGADSAWRAGVTRPTQGKWSDRRQEVVFIGVDTSEAALRSALDAYLLPDPFPAWDNAA